MRPCSLPRRLGRPPRWTRTSRRQWLRGPRRRGASRWRSDETRLPRAANPASWHWARSPWALALAAARAVEACRASVVLGIQRRGLGAHPSASPAAAPSTRRRPSGSARGGARAPGWGTAGARSRGPTRHQAVAAAAAAASLQAQPLLPCGQECPPRRTREDAAATPKVACRTGAWRRRSADLGSAVERASASPSARTASSAGTPVAPSRCRLGAGAPRRAAR
mmetsp:Transcript_38197/g.114086  ORF Transcript_38197/g.114086 Transcript_38197/m.114086 type:complete len:223 (+) Transcript_38197:199-867(+)